jgi:predicted ATP-grasp superfamily ATP-dependent carboligase
MDLYEMDDLKTRDGFLSNLSAAVTNAIETIRQRLPQLPSILKPSNGSGGNIQAANLFAEDDDRKRK